MEEIKSDRRDTNQASILKFLLKCTDLNVTRKRQAKCCDKNKKSNRPCAQRRKKSLLVHTDYNHSFPKTPEEAGSHFMTN